MSRTDTKQQRIRNLNRAEFRDRMRGGLGLRFGPFNARITADIDALVEPLYELYDDYPLIADDSIFSFHVRLVERRRLLRPCRPLIRFSVDGLVPHEDMPMNQALPVLEWGINLVVALRFHRFLMLHSAVVELDGGALLLPAAPGDGKSTLCAGLALSGWRLLSDEFGMLRPDTPELIPIPRPVALKNESIDVIRKFSSDAVLGPTIEGTRKGTVAHLKPPTSSVLSADRAVPARWVMFPRWRPDVSTTITEIPKVDAFMQLANNAFNYEVLGEPAFRTVDRLIKQVRCFDFEYSDLDNAVAALTHFARHENG